IKRNTLTKEICHAHGDMQDLISYAKTALRPIRVVVIDYAGLTKLQHQQQAIPDSTTCYLFLLLCQRSRYQITLFLFPVSFS
ncbi:hypothetical protein BX666DRAFT_1921101, partial [Dichotomocladium elegans]